MTRHASYHIHGAPPWGRNDGGGLEENPRQPEPRREAVYHCSGNRDRPCPHGTFTVPLAADAEPPLALDCRCGGTGRLDGAPEGAGVTLPGYRTHGKYEPPAANDVTPWAQLLKRRSPGDLEELLAERMAEVRQTGWAR